MASVWSGFLSFGLVTLPVRLHTGARGQRVSFHWLHDQDQQRLNQQMICPADNQPVPSEHRVRGYEYAKDSYLILTDAEIRAAAPPTQKHLEIVQFCAAAAVDPAWFETSYYLIPEPAGLRAHALLLRAMQQSQTVALAQLAMHQREYLALVRPAEIAPPRDESGNGSLRQGLLLHTLFYADELHLASEFGSAAASLPADPPAAEMELARQLIAGLLGPFQPEKFHDRYRANLEALIEARREHQAPPHPPGAPHLAPVVDIMQALKRSLEASKPSAARATAPSATSPSVRPVKTQSASRPAGKKPARSSRRKAA